MKSANPFIVVTNCEEAIHYYQRIFGGEIHILNQHGGKILHAELHVGNSLIHFSDTYGQTYTAGQNTKIILQFETEEEIRHVFETLLIDGNATIELQDTFFGALHGQVTDKNGIGWVLNYFR
ncbi:VOC family protein [Paenibacillus sp. SYP-B3998]|uniref:VOC family protein n=1 Tax=Paenibacillus sp. SYP-B3998 TaxID=2678564 RepID=A0A6G4A3H7_9BACL|nr:VOC family protein [Paenibacillus sp. SYP-B3998]NEW08942.1 VOC family protein [Paenibacillus sp. SYP-B3998]